MSAGVVDAALWAVAAVLGASALWMSRPRPPAYDPARIWGMTLSTLLRGDAERANQEVADWEAAVKRSVPTGIPGDWLADPATLGPDHDPAERIGPAASWDALAEDAPAAWATLDRVLEDVRFVTVGQVPELGRAVTALPAPDGAAIEALCADPKLRLVIVSATSAPATLRWLHDAPALRDRVRALVFLGAPFDPKWIESDFTHPAYDTELARETPWLVLRFRHDGVESPGLKTPPEPRTHRLSIRVHDLGVMDAAAWTGPLHGRALALLVAAIG